MRLWLTHKPRSEARWAQRPHGRGCGKSAVGSPWTRGSSSSLGSSRTTQSTWLLSSSPPTQSSRPVDSSSLCCCLCLLRFPSAQTGHQNLSLQPLPTLKQSVNKRRAGSKSQPVGGRRTQCNPDPASPSLRPSPLTVPRQAPHVCAFSGRQPPQSL